MKTVALIGCGRWGTNLYKTVKQTDGLKVTHVVDYDESAARKLVGFDEVEIVKYFPDVLGKVDTVMVASPAATHFSVAGYFLQQKVPVFLEKPMALSRSELKALEMWSRDVPLFLDHEYVYHQAIRWVKDRLGGELGDLVYFHSERLNSGTYRSDVDAAMNFLPHDVAVAFFLADVGDCYFSYVFGSGRIAGYDDATAVIEFPASYAVLRASWVSPGKVRRMRIGCTKGHVLIDDVAKKIVVTPVPGLDLSALDEKGSFKFGLSYEPTVSWDCLTDSVRAFSDWLHGGEEPPTSGRNSISTYKVLLEE